MKNLAPDDAPLVGAADELASLFIRASGDEQAATELYARCTPIITAWLRRRFPAEIAADAAHDALATAFAIRAKFNPSCAFLPWLKTIACRHAIDAIRRDMHRRQRERAFVESENLAAESRGTGCENDTLVRRMAALTSEQRRLIERRYLLGETSESIATSEGRKRTAVAVEIHRICKTLRSQDCR